ncbi:MAG: pyridoxal phosphate-dependent aminotransferase [Thermoplasmata archaeon]
MVITIPEVKDVFVYAHKHRNEIIWMSQNTNHLPTTDAIEKAVIEALREKEYNFYPYTHGIFGLREAILEDLGLPLQEFEALLTAGGTEALYITTRALLHHGDVVITSDPSYLIIHRFIELCGAKCTDFPIYRPPWKYNIDEVNEAITKKTEMILLIDPLNPLGSSYTRDEVKAICEIAKDNKLYVLHDITYRDFADSHTLATEFLPEASIVVYSVSKNCGLAGMRTGALVAHRELMNKLRPYNTNDLSINVLGQRAALAALQTKKEWFPKVKEVCRRNQAHIKEACDKIEGVFLPVYPSQANMFVIDISKTGIMPDAVQNELLYEHKIFVRSGTYVSKRFGQNFIRVSFSVPEEHAIAFKEKFPMVMEKLGRK